MNNEKTLKTINELLAQLQGETEALQEQKKLTKKQKRELKDKLQAYNSLQKIWDYYEK